MKKLKILFKSIWYVLREPLLGFIGLVISFSVIGGLVYSLSLIENIESIIFNTTIFLVVVGSLLAAILIIWMIVDEYKKLSKKEDAE